MSNARKQETASSGPNRARYALLLVTAALFAAGCDKSPTEPGLVGDAASELQAVQAVWADLPSSLELESAALDAMDQSQVAGDIAQGILDAGDLFAEADVATQLGVSTDAEELEETADALATRSILASLGGNNADDVLSRVERALATIDARLGSSAGTDARAHLSDAAKAISDARAVRGDAGGVLYHALRAADAIRWLDPEAKAKAAVSRAEALLARAEELAGETPEPPIARALNAAGVLCQAARRSVDAGLWRNAVLEAHRCARIARAVIVRLGGGVDQEVLAKRAEHAVANADGLLQRATEQAGPEPEARVKALLTEAEGLLGRARVALEEERYRAAIGLAIESSARSLRVLRILHHDDRPPYELRATAAVEIALALSARVDGKIGDDTPPEIVEADARADALLADAQAELEAGNFRHAWSLASQAITVYVRILVALA